MSSRIKGRLDEALDWLQPDPATAGYSLADVRTMRTLGMKPPKKKA